VIFVTVGSHQDFDRLIRGVDAWAGARGRSDVFAQIGPSAYAPQHIAWTQQLSPGEFAERMRAASAVVAHAGIGTIFTAMELGKPLLVMPRRADLHETRNDHQLATAERLPRFINALVVTDERDLPAALDGVEAQRMQSDFHAAEYQRLLDTIGRFINS